MMSPITGHYKRLWNLWFLSRRSRNASNPWNEKGEKIYETIVIKFYDRSKEDTECLSNILEKLGMQREGVLRNRMINNNGEKINKIIYSILKEEWENYWQIVFLEIK